MSAQGNGRFQALVGNENFNFETVTFEDRKITAAQVAIAVGKHPVEDFVVMRQLASGEIETLRPTETADLKDGVGRLFVIRGDRTLRFFVDGLSMEWPKEAITGLEVKRLVNRAPPDELVVVLERGDQPDLEIDDAELITLGAVGVEKIRLKPVKKTVVIYVNGKKNPVKISRGLHSGLSIKQAAISQGVKIQTDFILSLEKENGDTDIIGDGDEVRVKDGQNYTAVADDDTSYGAAP
jgi:hypothetical protein